MNKSLDEMFALFRVMGGIYARFAILMIIDDLLKNKDYETLELVAEELVKMDNCDKLNEYTKLTGEVVIP